MTFYKVSLSSSSLEGVASLREALGSVGVEEQITANPAAGNSPPPSPDTLGEPGVSNMDAAMDGGAPPSPEFMDQAADGVDSADSPPPSPDAQSAAALASIAPPVPVMEVKVKKVAKNAAKKTAPRTRKKKAS